MLVQLQHLALVGLVVLLPLISASKQTEGKQYHDSLDPKCLHGKYPGFEVNNFQYNAPATKFYDVVGSFFNGEWYLGGLGPITSTHGKDNTVGATRNATLNGAPYSERLVEFSRSPSKLILRYILDSGPLAFTSPLNDPEENFTLGSYTEELAVYSICSGRATYLSLRAVFCADNVATVYDVYEKLARATVQDVATTLKAKSFGGTCPL